jgi:indole-3-glycerol phosphate synthase
MNILEKIAVEKRREVEALRPRAAELKRLALQRKDHRDFAAALRPVGAASPPRLALIAEVKKASPSAGVIRADFDPVAIATEYGKAGASAISVLTDEKFFQGHISFLEKIREKVSLPLLRKDFIIDALQIYEAAAYSADAVLLIVAILDDGQLKEFRSVAEGLGLSALVEVHDEAELERAMNSGAKIIGINNRNLKTFEVDLKTTERLAALAGRVTSRGESVSSSNFTASVTRPTIVAESGIHTCADVERVQKAGANAILVGESLMRSGNIAAKVKELIGE